MENLEDVEKRVREAYWRGYWDAVSDLHEIFVKISQILIKRFKEENSTGEKEKREV